MEQHERVGLDQPGELVEHGQRVRRTGGSRRRRCSPTPARCRRAAARHRPPRRARPACAAGRRRAARRSGPASAPTVSTSAVAGRRRRAPGSVPATVAQPAGVLDRGDEAARLDHDLADLTGARQSAGRRAGRAEEYAASSTARTQARPHHGEARAEALRGGHPWVDDGPHRTHRSQPCRRSSSRRKVTRSRSSSSSSSVSAASPLPSTASASARLRVSSSAILLLDRAAGDQPVHLDRLGLADPVGAVGGLLLDGRVPPAVDVDDVVGAGQVEPGAAGLERQQEDRESRPVAGALEARDHRLALADGRAAVQELVIDTAPWSGAPRAGGPSRRTG